MRSIFNIFSSPPEMHLDAIQKKKGLFTSLHEYYEQKIKYLSDSKRLDFYLIMLATQDVPAEIRAQRESLGKDGYRKKCLAYYHGKVKEMQTELKKISKTKIKKKPI